MILEIAGEKGGVAGHTRGSGTEDTAPLLKHSAAPQVAQ